MSYFDSVRCSSCQTAFDPEKLAASGKRFSCPSCGEELRLADLFGLRDAFLEEEEEDLTLDDLVPGRTPRASAPQAAPRSAPPAQGRELPARQGEVSALDALKDLDKGR